LVEVLMALLIIAVTLALAARAFDGYLERSAAKRAAELFSQDLNVTKNAALRSRGTVVMAFDEGARHYVIRTLGGDTLFHRAFDGESDITLSSLDLELPGDSVAFDGSGVAELGEAPGVLGRAVFSAGATAYSVSFNSMGLTRVSGS
jgi:hypothetical protein